MQMHQKQEANLALIIELIQQLQPTQRRQLQQRLRVMGLWEADALLTDQNRLIVAPAIGIVHSVYKAEKSAAKKSVVTAEDQSLARTEISQEQALYSPENTSSLTAYRSPVSGKVVVGAPGSKAEVATTSDDPHAMLPIPGLAPEQPIEIIFDGGSKGNPGRGYGSYALRWPGLPQQIVQLQFGNQVTNNEAEYDTLIAALEAILKRLRDGDADPQTAHFTARGDSLLVINQLHGRWKCKEPRLQVRRDQALNLLQQFGNWQLIHHKRQKSVDVLGH